MEACHLLHGKGTQTVSTLGSHAVLVFMFCVHRAKTADCSQSSLKDLPEACLCSPWVFLQGTHSFVTQALALLHLETCFSSC